MLTMLRELWRFWNMTADLPGAHAELERHLREDSTLMREQWGPPANGEGWPEFDEDGKRRTTEEFLDRVIGPPHPESDDRATARLKNELGPEPLPFPPAEAASA